MALVNVQCAAAESLYELHNSVTCCREQLLRIEVGRLAEYLRDTSVMNHDARRLPGFTILPRLLEKERAGLWIRRKHRHLVAYVRQQVNPVANWCRYDPPKQSPHAES